jgi:predicted regulator of Ras-like GTPase activity (Roadblock/LC7/MglB family)
MRGADLSKLVAALRGPIEVFVHDARVRITLLVTGSGQVLAQHGFTSSYEVMNVASLAASANAASNALAGLMRVDGWKHMHHAGSEQEIFLAPLRTPIEQLTLVVIFDSASSLGLVQFFFGRLAQEIDALPDLSGARGSEDGLAFERDLQRGLDRIFSPEGGSEA